MRFSNDGPLSPEHVGDILEAVQDAADDAGIGIVITLGDEVPPRNVFVSRGAERLLGRDADELLDKTVWDYLAPEEIPRLAAMQQRRLAGEINPGTIEAQIVRSDGSRVPVEGFTRRASIAGRLMNVTFVFDLTARKEAEQALRHSEARFRSVVECSPDGIAILRGPTILFLNPAAARMLGYESAEEGVGQSIGDLLHPDDAPLAVQRLAHVMRTGEQFPDPTEYRSIRKDGSEITVEITSIRIEYEGAPAVLGFARDITERKAIQSRLVQADRLAAVGALAAGVAHEINNPLTYVSLSLKFLDREIHALGLDPERTSKLLARIKEASHGVDRVATIVKDLKAFARSDQDVTGPVDVIAVLEDAAKIAENDVRHRARLIRRYDEVPMVFGNAARLEQVFLNLLVNAAQALPEGDPTRDEIRLCVSRGDRDDVIVEIADTGVGIPDEVRHRIFDPFFTTKPVGVGTGLGLPICQGIVTGYGGDIRITSSSGKGTSVFVRLLAHSPALQTVTAARQPTRPPEATSRARVLVVDDEPFVGRLLGKLLGGIHDISVTVSGQEALDLLARKGPLDAIVCDLIMPGMSGMDLYERIRARWPGLERRMIFMTGGAFVKKIADFLSVVDNPKLEKPFETEQVLSAIQVVIKRAAESSPVALDSPSDP